MANEFELSFQGEGNLYVIIRRTDDARVWDGSELVPWNDAHLSSYAQPLLFRGGDVYQGDFPGGLSAGTYRILHYLRAGQSPSTADLLLSTRTIDWQSPVVSPPAEPVPVDDHALTSVEAVKGYLRLAAITQQQEDLLVALVNQVSQRIERICGRRFAARQWVERHALAMRGRITLRQYPVIHVGHVGVGRSEVMRVRFDAPGALAAQVAVQFDERGLDGVVRLMSLAGDGAESRSELSLETLPTVGQLAEAINDLPGWSAVVVKAASTRYLHALGTAAALGQAVPFTQPAQACPWWDLDAPVGRLRLWEPAGWAMVEYRAGYESIPGDLQLAATELVAQAYQQGRQNPAVKSESLGDYSYTLATQTQISDDLWSRLRLYMEVR